MIEDLCWGALPFYGGSPLAGIMFHVKHYAFFPSPHFNVSRETFSSLQGVCFVGQAGREGLGGEGEFVSESRRGNQHPKKRGWVDV